ncbi:helix-turn-helix domain-containing protein [Flavobacterium rakeshii]|uniref:Helix-turn-helix domain-containing protein n=1 Tax=Flavobacterium rakeshii TaxID=1038845 RepID=A0A6N8H9F9_9FLAO|nr:helix-turn-helix transcriptional regulator [Flavobacterium rakeshii]MUV03194.1 helix-turn-helix domain-containing protein [Flavobacterium rakeshii]
MNNFIGLNIKYLCDKNYLSQKEFGDLFDIKQSTVASYVGGRSNPNVETMQRICVHFELMIDDFINKDLNAAQYTQKEVPAQKQHVSVANEQNTPYNHEKDALIAALRETIDTQRELIATLRSRLDNTQTKAS